MKAQQGWPVRTIASLRVSPLRHVRPSTPKIVPLRSDRPLSDGNAQSSGATGLKRALRNGNGAWLPAYAVQCGTTIRKMENAMTITDHIKEWLSDAPTLSRARRAKEPEATALADLRRARAALAATERREAKAARALRDAILENNALSVNFTHARRSAPTKRKASAALEYAAKVRLAAGRWNVADRFCSKCRERLAEARSLRRSAARSLRAVERTVRQDFPAIDIARSNDGSSTEKEDMS